MLLVRERALFLRTTKHEKERSDWCSEQGCDDGKICCSVVIYSRIQGRVQISNDMTRNEIFVCVCVHALSNSPLMRRSKVIQNSDFSLYSYFLIIFSIPVDEEVYSLSFYILGFSNLDDFLSWLNWESGPTLYVCIFFLLPILTWTNGTL